MKANFIGLCFLCAVAVVNAAVLKSVNPTSSGTLISYFTPSERNTVTDLILGGNLDARDFQFIRDSLKVLANLDMYNAEIIVYNGKLGTDKVLTYYPSKSIPYSGLCGTPAHPNVNLSKVVLPKTTVSILNNAFSNCANLSKVTMPTGLTSIGQSAFESTAVDSITIPNTVVQVSPMSFSDCESLTKIKLSNSMTFIAQSMFNNCVALVGIDIPESVTSINRFAFSSCINLKNVVLPSKLVSIGSSAFDKCYGLKNVTVKNPVPIDLYTTSDNTVFGVVPPDCILWVPQGTSNLYSYSMIWNYFQIIKEVGVTIVSNQKAVVPNLKIINKQLVVDGIDDDKPSDYQIINSAGMLKKLGTITTSESIDVDNLNAGVYVLRIKNLAFKFIIQ